MSGLKEFINGLDENGLATVYNVLSPKFSGTVTSSPDQFEDYGTFDPDFPYEI